MNLQRFAITAAAAALALPAQALIVTSWTFNSPTPDGNANTGWPLPNVGTGSAGLFGFTSFYYASGDGSTDPAPTDNTAWYTRPYPAQGTRDRSAGVVFFFPTAGLADLDFSWDQYHAPNASKYVQVQYALSDAGPYEDAPGGLFSATLGGDRWYSRSLDLGAIPEIHDAPAFRLRIVPTFAPGTLAYEASTPGFSYGPNGPLAYDMVTVSTAVPEPGSLALFGVGLAVLCLRRRDGGAASTARAERAITATPGGLAP